MCYVMYNPYIARRELGEDRPLESMDFVYVGESPPCTFSEVSFVYGYSVSVSSGPVFREVVDDVFDACIVAVEGMHR